MASNYQDLRKKINQSKSDLNEIERYLKEGEALENDLEKNAFQIEDRMNRIETKLVNLKGLEELVRDLEEVMDFVLWKKRQLEDPKNRLKVHLGAELDRRFKEKGWVMEGNLPELKVGVLTLEFLLAQCQVKIWYGPKIELQERSGLVIEDMVGAVVKVYKHLDDGSFQEERDFLELIFGAYGNMVKKKGVEFGSALSIIEWLGEVAWLRQDKRFIADPRKENFKNYGRTQFSYDLFRLQLRECNEYELHLNVATREQTKKKENNLWIPRSSRGEGTHFSTLCFRRQLME